MEEQQYRFETQVIHAMQSPDEMTGAICPPIFQTATYLLGYAGTGDNIVFNGSHGYTYTRTANPTTTALEKRLAALAGTEDCVVTASGLGAISAVLHTLLQPGDHVVAGDVIYGSTTTLFQEHFRKFGVEFTYVDTADLAAVEAAVRPNTKLLYIESPANPNLKVSDIEACAVLAHAHQALLAVDSTFAPMPIQFPNRLGADICVYSTTKYINGHGTALGGAILGNKQLLEPFRTYGVKLVCANPASPFNSWLTMLGLKTLDIRMRRHCEVAMEVACFLENSHYVEKVYYPGLESHPQYQTASRQMNGLYGGMLAFELADGIGGHSKLNFAKRFLTKLKLITLAASLGELDTLIEHPASMTHRAIPAEERLKAGITDGLVRMSIGVENPKDLIADLQQAFAAAEKD